MRIVIHIDNLVLNGVDRLDGPGFEAALRRQLLTQIESGGLPAGWRNGAAVQSLTAAYPPGSTDVGTAGEQVARLLTTGTGAQP